VSPSAYAEAQTINKIAVVTRGPIEAHSSN
jgi:hypothetical protein